MQPGNYGPAFGSDLLSKDPIAADKMRLKELKNGRLAMLAIMGVAFNHVLPGSFPGCGRGAVAFLLLAYHAADVVWCVWSRTRVCVSSSNSSKYLQVPNEHSDCMRPL